MCVYAQPCDPELFAKALQCLLAIGSAISPDYAISQATLSGGQWGSTRQDQRKATLSATSAPDPSQLGGGGAGRGAGEGSGGAESASGTPTNEHPPPFAECFEVTRRFPLEKVAQVHLTEPHNAFARKFAEHYYDNWVISKIDEGWMMGDVFSEEQRTIPNLVPYKQIPDKHRLILVGFADNVLRAAIALGWSIEPDLQRQANQEQQMAVQRRQVAHSVLIQLGGAGIADDFGALAEHGGNFTPPMDLRNIQLPKEMQALACELTQLLHERSISIRLERVWRGVDGFGRRQVPFDMLTRAESYPLKSFIEVHVLAAVLYCTCIH